MANRKERPERHDYRSGNHVQGLCAWADHAGRAGILGIKKFPDGVAVAMFNSAKRAPETIRQNRRNLEEVFNSILAAHGCDTYYPLIFPPREGVDF